MDNEKIFEIVLDVHAMLHEIDKSVSESFAERMNLFQDDESVTIQCFKDFLIEFLN